MHAECMQSAFMSKQVHIRDLKENVHARLTENAAQAGLSLSQYLRMELEALAMNSNQTNVLQRLRELPGKNAGASETTDMDFGMREGSMEQSYYGTPVRPEQLTNAQLVQRALKLTQVDVGTTSVDYVREDRDRR
jgi:hypothetical protein